MPSNSPWVPGTEVSRLSTEYNLRLGELVEIKHEGSSDDMNHFGVYAGEGWIYHNKWPKIGGKVVKEYKTNFIWYNNSSARIFREWDNNHSVMSSVLDRAESRLGSTFCFRHWNCEHFVTWCRYGYAFSPQLDAYQARGGDVPSCTC